MSIDNLSDEGARTVAAYMPLLVSLRTENAALQQKISNLESAQARRDRDLQTVAQFIGHTLSGEVQDPAIKAKAEQLFKDWEKHGQPQTIVLSDLAPQTTVLTGGSTLPPRVEKSR